MLEDYVDDRAKGFEKSAFLVGGEGRTPLLICCIVCCMYYYFVFIYIILYTLHLRLTPVMTGTLPQPHRILSARGQKNLSVAIFLYLSVDSAPPAVQSKRAGTIVSSMNVLRGFTSLIGKSASPRKDDSPDDELGFVSQFVPPSISTNIRGHEMTYDGYTVYIIDVTFGLKRWQIRRRYKRFHELHTDLGFEVSKSIFGYVNLPRMPPKKMCGNTAHSFVERRMEQLNNYLDKILKDERVSSTRHVRNFLSPLKTEDITLFWNLHYELLKRGASFNKKGTLFVRDIFIQLNEDDTLLEYWSPSEDIRKYAQDVKSVHIASIRNVRISNNGSAIVVEAERELRLETHEQGVKHQWIRALQFLQKAAHLCCPATSLSGKMPTQQNSINSHPQQNRNQSRKFERNGNNANFKRKGGNDNQGRSFMNNSQKQ